MCQRPYETIQQALTFLITVQTETQPFKGNLVCFLNSETISK